MLQLSASMLQRQVLSLRTSAPIADVIAPIINPDNLKIEGFYCREFDGKQNLVLLYQDIREVLPQGIVVNDSEVLTDPVELVRLKVLLDQDYNILNQPVETVSGDKVGKVHDYAFETSTMYIKKLYVSRSLLKSLANGHLSIDRNQIQEVTLKKVIIHDLLQGTTVPVGLAA